MSGKGKGKKGKDSKKKGKDYPGNQFGQPAGDLLPEKFGKWLVVLLCEFLLSVVIL